MIENIIVTKYVGCVFFGICPAGVLVVSNLYFGGGWCLGGPLCVRGILTVLGDILGILLMLIFCDVAMMSG